MKQDSIKELQNVELEILKEFIKICEKLNINYYLIGGTLLGAVRHKGFIPWDDDIDVCMLRKDYEKLIKYGSKYLNKDYFLQTYESDLEYPHCFAKIRNNNTTFIESSLSDKRINHGIYIDIFPLDNYHDLSFFEKCKNKLVNYQLFKEYYKKNNSFIRKVLIIFSNIIYGKKSNKQLCRIKDSIFQKKNKYNIEQITNYCGAWGIKKETHRKDCFKDYKIVDFENIKVKIPVGYDEILKNMYGDYMKLPPKEKQVTHHYTDVIDTKKSYKEYVNY